MNVDRLLIEAVLGAYRPDFRFLETLENTYPTATGTFKIPENSYTSGPRMGLSAASGILLFNQSMMTHIGNALIQKRIAEAAEFDLSPERFLEFCDHVVVQRFDEIVYKKLILKTSDLFFKISVDACFNKLKSRGIIFFKTSMNVCGNKHTLRAAVCFWSKKYN